MKKFLLILGVMAVALSATIVFAGFKNTTDVVINAGTTTTTVYGSLEATRNTPDTTAYFYCQSSILGTRGTCAARNTAGTTVSAYTTDPNVIAQIQSVSSSSYIYMIFDNATSRITTLSITNGSHLLP